MCNLSGNDIIFLFLSSASESLFYTITPRFSSKVLIVVVLMPYNHSSGKLERDSDPVIFFVEIHGIIFFNGVF